jgi:hypothetical protein
MMPLTLAAAVMMRAISHRPTCRNDCMCVYRHDKSHV